MGFLVQGKGRAAVLRTIVTAAAFVLATAAYAAAPDPALKTFLAGFSDALRRGALEAAAGMTHFPIQNDVYQDSKTINRAEFKRHFGMIKEAGFAACLAKTAPKKAGADSRRLGDFDVDCDGNVFYFRKFEGQWRYSGFENVNE
jgi:hypothetical protein